MSRVFFETKEITDALEFTEPCVKKGRGGGGGGGRIMREGKLPHERDGDVRLAYKAVRDH